MKYSVIIPIYNREKSIKKCIDSILRQSEKDFELILVDDGSTDNSLKICKDFEKTDNRIIVIHKENGGVSSARNAGIDVARGKYVVFVDSDDYVDNNYLEILSSKDADLVISGVIFENTQNKIDLLNDFTLLDEMLIIDFFSQYYALPCWGKKYDRNIIKKNNLRFDTSICYGEDALFCAQYINKCKTMSYIRAFTYHYCDSFSTSLSKIGGCDFIKQYNLVQQGIYYTFAEKPKVKEFLNKKYLWYAENTFKKIAKSDLNYTEKIKRINLILKSDYFKTCIKNCEKSSLTTVNRICYKFGLSRFILYRMKKSN